MRRFIDGLLATRRSLGRALTSRMDRLARTGDNDPVNTPSVSDATKTAEPPGGSTEADVVREGALVRLRPHVVANRSAFQRWYADEEIARLLRHDQRPLNWIQSRSYFDTIIMPLSARGMCFAIHETASDLLVGTTALTDVEGSDYRSALFRIVIGEKACWGQGFGTEATRLVVEEAFGPLRLDEVRLEVFRHNARAMAAYKRVGFRETGSHVEFVGRDRFELHVVEMALDRTDYFLLRESERDDESGSATVDGLATPMARAEA